MLLGLIFFLAVLAAFMAVAHTRNMGVAAGLTMAAALLVKLHCTVFFLSRTSGSEYNHYMQANAERNFRFQNTNTDTIQSYNEK